MASLQPQRDGDKTYPEFVDWWTHLDPTGRDAYEQDYRKGCENVIDKARKELEAAVARRQEGAGSARVVL